MPQQCSWPAWRALLVPPLPTRMKACVLRSGWRQLSSRRSLRRRRQWIADHEALRLQMMEQMSDEQQMMKDHCGQEGR